MSFFPSLSFFEQKNLAAPTTQRANYCSLISRVSASFQVTEKETKLVDMVEFSYVLGSDRSKQQFRVGKSQLVESLHFFSKKAKVKSSVLKINVTSVFRRSVSHLVRLRRICV